ncbi:MAG: O-antigen ligase family protein [Bryobacterales bacterium]|nr:O-antigen ligase family protein [Bryobacterales bacterium]
MTGVATLRARRALATWTGGLVGGPLTVALASNGSPLITLGAIAGLFVGISMLMFPFWGFLLTTLVVPLERIGRMTDDSNAYTFSIMRLLGLVNLAAVLLRAGLCKAKLKFSLPVVLYGSYLVVGTVSLLFSPDGLSGIRALGMMLGNLLFLFLIPNMVETRQQVRLLLICWLTVTTLIGVFTIVQWHRGAAVTDSRFHSTGERTTDERFSVILRDHSEFDLGASIPRALGPTSHPAVYGINVIMTIPFFAYFMRIGTNWKHQFLALVGGLVASYNVLLTNTRAAAVCLAVVIGLVFWKRLLRLRAEVVFGAILVGVLLLPAIPPALYERIFDVSNYSASRSKTLSARFLYWKACLEAIVENPLIGVGLGNQMEIPKRITSITMPPNSTAHNEYLNSLMEVGFAGYAILLSFFVVLYRRCRKAEAYFNDSGDGETALLLTAAKVMFLGVLFYAVQVDCFHFPLKGWWLVMGVAIVLHDVARKEAARGSISPA